MGIGSGGLRPTRYVTTSGVAMAVAIALVSCGHDETRIPVTPLGPSAAPAPPSVDIGRLDLIAPASIAPGEVVQLRATVMMANGSTQDVTSLASWNPSSTRILEVNGSGVARGVGSGEVVVNARYQTRTASTNVIVVPAGTYRLRGLVEDEGAPLSAATVTVVGGAGEGTKAVTGFDGSYVLYGVGGHVRIQVKRDGYVNLLQELDVAEHRTVNFPMALDRARDKLEGTYTFVVDARCTTGELKVAVPRRYEARLMQTGSRVDVTLSGADFVVVNGRGNHFDGQVDPTGRVMFFIGELGSYYYYYFDTGRYEFVERLTDTNALVITGIFTADVTPSRLSGAFSGFINVTRGLVPPFYQFDSACFSTSHPFEMIRR